LRNYWFFQFLYLIIVASALTAGLYHDDIRSGNLELLLSRRISASRLVLAKFASPYLFGLLVPVTAFATAVAAFRQPAEPALQFVLVSMASLAFWTAAFCILSGLLPPRFNWMVVLAVYLTIPRWLSFDTGAYSLAQMIASANGFAAFTTLSRWQTLDSVSLLAPLAATGCLLMGQVVMVNMRWMRA
jgi:ABC-type transport system involved in multi-copper enzyme maturation permease subunit